MISPRAIGLIALLLAANIIGVKKSFSQLLCDPTPIGEDNFGFALAIDDAGQIIVGARRDDLMGSNVGQAHLFLAKNQSLIITYNDPTPSIQDNFGTSVAIDNGLALIGAPQDSNQNFLQGQASLLDATSGQLIHTFDDPTPTSTDFFGSAVALSGNRIIVGAPGDDSNGNGVGQAHLFETESGKLITTIDDRSATAFDGFGTSLAISENWLVIGEPGDDSDGFNIGQVHIFNPETGSLIRSLHDPTPTEADSFGSSVSIYEDLVIVGAPGDDSTGFNVGQVYLFDAHNGTLLQTFDHPSPNAEAAFGSSVAINGINVLVGSPQSMTEAGISGQAFILDRDTANLVVTINGDSANVDDALGFSVALSDEWAIVGVPFDDAIGEDIGQVELVPVVNVLLGDVNLDELVNLLDIAPFVDLIASGSFQAEADVNRDGEVDLLDISRFVEILAGS